MQSSLAVTARAIIMLACVVGIPALAVSGASWPDILKKFQDFRLPAFLNAKLDTPVALADAPPFKPNRSVSGQVAAATDQPQSPNVAIQPPAGAASDTLVGAADLQVAPTDLRNIQQRLRGLGATYYLLESWGSDQQLYRFYCKVAVGGNADYTHWFEAIHADPLEAMRQVLRRVETWRGGLSMSVGRSGSERGPLLQ
ncbi:MAG: hypothetical protein LLG00_03205 [Planctomycetaceae bacterium]|nr:hypothetical protein [Planctomycetaceae bacterium]